MKLTLQIIVVVNLLCVAKQPVNLFERSPPYDPFEESHAFIYPYNVM